MTARGKNGFNASAQGNALDSLMTEEKFKDALAAGNVDFVTRFLEKYPEAADREGEGGLTPLIKASWLGHHEIVRLLLDLGADVNRKTHNGMTALMMAAMNGKKEAVEALLEAGADTEIKSEKNPKAASFARGMGHHEIADMIDRWPEIKEARMKEESDCSRLGRSMTVPRRLQPIRKGARHGS